MREHSELQQYKERLAAAASAANLGIWDWEPRTDRLFCTPALETIYGLPPGAFRSYENFSRRVHPDDLKPTEDSQLAAVINRQPFTHKFRIIRPDGTIRWIESKGRAFYDAAGNVERILGTNQDITERETLERSLKASEERYRSVVEDQTEAICRFRPDGTFTFVNEVYCRTFGKPADELVGKVWQPTAHADDLPMIEARLAEMSPDNPVVIIENRVHVAGGEVRWMQFVNRGFYDADGRLGEIQAVGRDITGKKQDELALREGKEQLDLIVRHFPGLVARIDRDLRYRYASPGYEEWFGIPPADILGHTPDYVLGREAYTIAEPFVKRALAGEQVSLENQAVVAAGAQRRWVHVNLVPAIDADGERNGFFVFATDITQRKRVELELKVQEERLEMALTAAGLVEWEWNLADHRMRAGNGFTAMFGYAAEEFGDEEGRWLSLVHAQDKAGLERDLKAHLDGTSASFQNQHRIRHKNGHWIEVETLGKVVQRGQDGTPLRMVGTIADITQRKRLNEEGVSLLRQIEALIRESSSPAPKAESGGSPLDSLTRRERQILGLIAEGMTSARIATQLHLSANTVANHRQNLMAKLNLHNTAELTRFAIDHDLTKVK